MNLLSWQEYINCYIFIVKTETKLYSQILLS